VLVIPSVFISCVLHFWRIISNTWTRFLVDYTSSRVSDHGDFLLHTLGCERAIGVRDLMSGA
jgi:hypothetical protein